MGPGVGAGGGACPLCSPGRGRRRPPGRQTNASITSFLEGYRVGLQSCLGPAGLAAQLVERRCASGTGPLHLHTISASSQPATASHQRTISTPQRTSQPDRPVRILGPLFGDSLETKGVSGGGGAPPPPPPGPHHGQDLRCRQRPRRGPMGWSLTQRPGRVLA